MNSAELERRVTPEEYLVAERRAEWKSEFVGGIVREMSRPSRWHILIAGNISRVLSNQLQSRVVDVFQSAMRLKVNATGLYTYPDVIVVDGESQLEDDECDTLLNPTLIVEILSDSTADYDRSENLSTIGRSNRCANTLWSPKTSRTSNCSLANCTLGHTSFRPWRL